MMKARTSSLILSVVLLLGLLPGRTVLTTAQSPTFLAASALSEAEGLPTAPDRTQVTAALPSMSMMFVENVGQFAEGARFQVRGGKGMLWLAEDALWITVVEQGDEGTEWLGRGARSHLRPSASQPRRGVNLKLSFVGANPHPCLEPFNRLDTRVSYFIGNDPEKWHVGVPVWGGVRYKDLYPGVDLELTCEGGRLTQRLAVRSGAALSAVRLRVEGADALALDSDVLRLSTTMGVLSLPPFSLSPTPLISASPASASDLFYAAFLGGSDYDLGHAVAVDATGAAYVTGSTDSSNFPDTPGAFETTHSGSNDAFVTKVAPDGSHLAYSTFLGGSGPDTGYGIAVGDTGAAYVTGITDSSDFPDTPGAFETTHSGGSDAFVAKLSADGSDLVYSTYLGGSSDDQANDVALDGTGYAYVTGDTGSSDFPTTSGAFDEDFNSSPGNWDAFVTKVEPDGSGLTYSTFLGGSIRQSGQGIAVDTAGAAYVTGYTYSTNFPTTSGAFDQTHNGSEDVFFTKVKPDGSSLDSSTYIGGGECDWANDIAIGDTGHAYITGRTGSTSFPTTSGAFDQTHNGSEDVFVTKVKSDGSTLIYSTFVGDSDSDEGKSIAVDSTGTAYVTGSTSSSNFPTTANAYDRTYNSNTDVFVTKVGPNGSTLAYSTFLGGSDVESGQGIAVNITGDAYVTGLTFSSGFPTTLGAFDTTFNGVRDAFVVKSAAGGEVVTGLIPTTGGSLSSSSGDTSFVFPNGAFTQTVRLTYRSLSDRNTGALMGIGHTFGLTAIYSDTGQPAQLATGVTYTVTVTYTTSGLAIENTLAFYNWDGDQWVEETSSEVDTSNNTVTATPNHLSLWAVLGETKRVYLPLTLRNH